MKGASPELPELAAPADRLALAIFIATAFHAMLILGITFAPEDRSLDKNTPTLEITVVQKRSEAPEDADYLAQANQDGAGNIEERVRPQPALEAQTPPPAAQPEAPQPPQAQVVTQRESDIPSPSPAEQAPEQRQLPKASELIDRSLEMLTLNQEINQSMIAYSQRPREKFISARTREFKYANYMNDWVNKVERVGELNYPDEARRSGLSGSLLVDVALNADGTVRNITIRRPSGHKVLDDAAVRIVRLAAPFPPFPPEIREETEILHITRTWEFTSGNRLQGR
jgi:protein TonB